jgi:hypothetical protein
MPARSCEPRCNHGETTREPEAGSRRCRSGAAARCARASGRASVAERPRGRRACRSRKRACEPHDRDRPRAPWSSGPIMVRMATGCGRWDHCRGWNSRGRDCESHRARDINRKPHGSAGRTRSNACRTDDSNAPCVGHSSAPRAQDCRAPCADPARRNQAVRFKGARAERRSDTRQQPGDPCTSSASGKRAAADGARRGSGQCSSGRTRCGEGVALFSCTAAVEGQRRAVGGRGIAAGLVAPDHRTAARRAGCRS